MKKIIFFLGVILVMSVALLGFRSSPDDQTKDNMNIHSESGVVLGVQDDKQPGEKVDLAKGVNDVLAALEELKNVVENDAKNSSEINKHGKLLEEKWDVIEKQVEEKYPQDYINIEQSLYPLLDFAKKEKPNLERIKQLIGETADKLTMFKNKVAK